MCVPSRISNPYSHRAGLEHTREMAPSRLAQLVRLARRRRGVTSGLEVRGAYPSASRLRDVSLWALPSGTTPSDRRAELISEKPPCRSGAHTSMCGWVAQHLLRSFAAVPTLAGFVAIEGR